MTIRSGLHGLFRLDGAPVDATDAAALDLPADGPPGPVLARGIDRMDPTAVGRRDQDGEITILVGHIHDVAALAERLALPPQPAPVDLAREALRRFGAETPTEMLGEWSLLRWEPSQPRLTIMLSAARRDRMFYRVAGNRCAISSHLFRMTRLPWIGRNISETGLLLHFGRSSLRAAVGNRSMVEGVSQVPPGGSVVITADGIRTFRADALTPQPHWHGSFEEACAEGERLLLQAIRDRTGGSANPGVLLSGGLDSALLAWAAAEPGNRRLHLFTSAAPPGSGLPDETAFADIVADVLGLGCQRVYPRPDGDPYRPPLHSLRATNGAMLSNRQPLTDAFQDAGREAGATSLLNGTYGEFSLSGSVFPMTLRRRAATWLYRLRHPVAQPGPADAFHLCLSAHRLARLPDEVQAAIAAPPTSLEKSSPSGLWGYAPGVRKALGQDNEYSSGALRMEFPFRDVRLLRFFAGLPESYFTRDDLDRAPARRILQGRLPDSIRLRTRGMPASPDHLRRLQDKAGQARQRIATFRAAGVDEWLDLDWLDQGLARIAACGPGNPADAARVQMTAANAELLTWWREGV